MSIVVKKSGVINMERLICRVIVRKIMFIIVEIKRIDRVSSLMVCIISWMCWWINLNLVCLLLFSFWLWCVSFLVWFMLWFNWFDSMFIIVLIFVNRNIGDIESWIVLSSVFVVVVFMVYWGDLVLILFCEFCVVFCFRYLFFRFVLYCLWIWLIVFDWWVWCWGFYWYLGFLWVLFWVWWFLWNWVFLVRVWLVRIFFFILE